jgi:hypothetical protein
MLLRFTFFRFLCTEKIYILGTDLVISVENTKSCLFVAVIMSETISVYNSILEYEHYLGVKYYMFISVKIHSFQKC